MCLHRKNYFYESGENVSEFEIAYIIYNLAMTILLKY